MSSVVVHIDHFSGPMALLLHLIRKEEMDIFDINIHEITEQYLNSIKAMKKLNLELAGDFIAMAATLIQIKSKMLLPQYDESGEIIETEDPRKELVKRLIEYQMYQEAGQNLYKRPLLGRDVWARGLREDFKTQDDGIIMEEENALYALISAYRTAMKNMKKAVHKVAESLQSIADRIWELRDLIRVGRSVRMSELITAKENRASQVLITFLSLLEMAKIGIVSLFQSDNFSDIHIEAQRDITEDAISNVENYESQVHTPMSAGMKDVDVSELQLDEPDAGAQTAFTMEEASAPDMMTVAEELTGHVADESGLAVETTEVSIPVDAFATYANNTAAGPQDEAFVIEAATDEDILNEEKLLFGESDSETKKEPEAGA